MAQSTRTVGFRPHLSEEGLPPLSAQESATLALLGSFLEGDLPWLSRALADEVGLLHLRRSDPLHRQRSVEVGVINRRRRAARSFFVHLFQGEIEENFLRTLRGAWLPEILNPDGSGTVGAQAARTFLDYAKGLLAGALHFDPNANLVPMVRLQRAVDAAFQRMRVFLGA